MKVPHEYHFIIQLGKSLHSYGLPSYKIQEYLKNVAKKRNIVGSFMDLPTWINYAFYNENGDQTYHYVEMVKPGEINLGALSKSVEITNKVLNNKLDYDQASRSLIYLQEHKQIIRYRYQIIAFGLSALSFSMIINTNLISCIIALILGLCIGVMVYWSKKSTYIESTLETFSAFFATLIVGLLYSYLPDLHISITILSAIIVFIPGLSLTTSLEEIASKSLVSGTSKLFSAIITLFKLFFGVLLGITLLPLISEIPNYKEPYHDLPKWISYLGMLLFSFSLLFIFQVRRKDLFWGFLMGSISFLSVSFLAPLGILLSTFIGTLIVVVLSNIFKKLSQSPKIIFLTLGIIMMVPGSKAFIGLSSLFIKTDAPNTQNIGDQIFFILMGIIGGLIVSGTFKKSR